MSFSKRNSTALLSVNYIYLAEVGLNCPERDTDEHRTSTDNPVNTVTVVVTCAEREKYRDL